MKYTKTVVAYANTQGGKLVFGVVDETREIAGIDESILFQTMDSIANAISDSCEPQIVSEIEPYTVEGKTVINWKVLKKTNDGYLASNALAIREMIINAHCHRIGDNVGDVGEKMPNDGDIKETATKINGF